MGRILVADDHDSLRRGIVRALTDAKHEVDEAPNGNVAIENVIVCSMDDGHPAVTHYIEQPVTARQHPAGGCHGGIAPGLTVRSRRTAPRTARTE